MVLFAEKLNEVVKLEPVVASRSNCYIIMILFPMKIYYIFMLFPS